MPPKQATTTGTPVKRKAPMDSTPSSKKTKNTPTSGQAAPSPLNREYINIDSDEDVTDINTPTKKTPTTKRLSSVEPPVVKKEKMESEASGKQDSLPQTCRQHKLDFSAADATIIKFVDGDDKKLGILHKVAIDAYCEDLRKVLANGESEESATHTIVLTKVEPETFQFFNNWCYFAFHDMFASCLDSVQFAKLWCFAIDNKVAMLEVDVINQLFHRFKHETTAPALPENSADKATLAKTEFVQFIALAYSFGPNTSLAKLCLDRITKLAKAGGYIEGWFNSFPGPLKKAWLQRIHRMVRFNATNLEGFDFNDNSSLSLSMEAKRMTLRQEEEEAVRLREIEQEIKQEQRGREVATNNEVEGG